MHANYPQEINWGGQLGRGSLLLLLNVWKECVWLITAIIIIFVWKQIPYIQVG
jgi:hypothetical protein